MVVVFLLIVESPLWARIAPGGRGVARRAAGRPRPDRIAASEENPLSDDLRLFDHTFEAGPGDHLTRLDVFLVRRFPGWKTRSMLT